MANCGRNRDTASHQRGFGVQFHPVYLSEFLADLVLSHAIPRTKRPARRENAEEILEERVGDAFDKEEDDGPHNNQDSEV